MKTQKRAAKAPALMTYPEYAKTKHTRPYPLRLVGETRVLYYFGERHSFNPTDVQWKTMKKFWQRFLKETKGKKRIAFVEGGTRKLSVSEKKAILSNGGMGLLTYVADKADIPTYSPEPNEKKERAELEKTFSRDEIQYYYFARVVYQWTRTHEPRVGFGEYMEPFLRGDKVASGWKKFDFSLQNMEKIHYKLFTTKYEPTAERFWYDITNPVIGKSIVNRVSTASSRLRDEHIVNEILRYMKKGYSIFAEYGCSHVVMQEPLLRASLKE